MSEELRHLIVKAVASLKLDANQAEYLSNVIEIAYGMGDIHGYKQAAETTIEILNKKGSKQLT